jgi:hypothetical protein
LMSSLVFALFSLFIPERIVPRSVGSAIPFYSLLPSS